MSSAQKKTAASAPPPPAREPAAPRGGRARRERERMEDVLRALLECEHSGQPATEAALAGMVDESLETTMLALARAQATGLAESTGTGWRSTPPGREIAVLVMRAHRLIETRLARESSVPADEWHDIAHADEHRLSRDEVNRLADRLGNPRFDPHGDPIPTREGTLPEREGCALLAWQGSSVAVIEHIEDEPPALFSRLAAAGVHAGMRFVLGPTSPAGCELTLEGRRLTLPFELAALIRVRPLGPGEAPPPAGVYRLSELPPGGATRVLRLLPGCVGPERSRLLDLGFVPGSEIVAELQSPFGGPVAYRVRGTLIALRHEQAEQVLVLDAPAPTGAGA